MKSIKDLLLCLFFAYKVFEHFFNFISSMVWEKHSFPIDIIKITIFIPNYDLAFHRPILNEVRSAVFGTHAPASSLVGVQALVFPEILIEIEAVAVIG